MRGEHGDRDVSEHLRRLVRDDEEISWHAKPDKQSFYLKHIVGSLVAAVFLGFFLSPFLGGAFALATALLFGEQAVLWGLGGLALVVFIGVPIVIWATARRQYDYAEYAVTDDRVIHSSGLIGRDSSSVSLKDIRDIDVNVGVVDKFFGTGKLEFQTAGGGNSGAAFTNVSDPYDALETIETVRREAEKRSQAA